MLKNQRDIANSMLDWKEKLPRQISEQIQDVKVIAMEKSEYSLSGDLYFVHSFKFYIFKLLRHLFATIMCSWLLGFI